jgi:hypothetical protein
MEGTIPSAFASGRVQTGGRPWRLHLPWRIAEDPSPSADAPIPLRTGARSLTGSQSMRMAAGGTGFLSPTATPESPRLPHFTDRLTDQHAHMAAPGPAGLRRESGGRTTRKPRIAARIR